MALKQDIALLRTIPVFAALGREPLRLIAFSAENRQYPAGTVLFRRGEASAAGYVVMSGLVELDAGDGAKPESAATGTLIGELALMIDTERPATATVREAASMLRIPRATFHRVLEEFPETAAAVRDLLATRARVLSARLSGVRFDLLAIERVEAERLEKAKGRA